MIYISDVTVALLTLYAIISSALSSAFGWKRGLCYTGILFLIVYGVASGLAGISEHMTIVEGV